MEKGKLIGEGRTAEVFEWGQDKILKLFRIDLPKTAIQNEYEVSIGIYNQLNSTPKVYELIEVDNRSGIVYERINGITMMKVVASNPWKVKKEAQRLAELHKSIQQKVNFKLSTYKTRLKDNISNTALLTDDIKTRLYKYIDKLKDDNILCHGDFHPDNILITKDGEIVIDWMTATQGNPLTDIARTSIMFKFGVVPNKTFPEKQIINFIRNKFYLEYISHYLKLTGVKIEQIEQWELPVAAARLTEWLPKDEKTALLNFIDKTMETLKI
ncbi:phosphotransferase [Clostridium sp. CF011]|uniref:aminoglycoside phosphotransferase family protein n=1 Tax=Clostridium sp. CF011 TaxID=2843318 RepID=UPI001C0B08E3|nr:aminoglycoside phosphotransferase family protein [Clostridium sp. CF011]MBU3093196.1 phosphotransferase [Clostridium sp. CF011]WAG69299.1 phosphotransferase [Clostridium sp. CF011]